MRIFTHLTLAIFLLTATACGSSYTPKPPLELQRMTAFSTPHSADMAVLWQGLSFDWGYNHRLNRLGSYIPPHECSSLPCQAAVVNTAASGTGKDQANATTYYSFLKTKGVGLQTGETVLELTGREEMPIQQQLRVRVPLAANLIDRQHYQVVLNGFDIYATAGKKAKKLQHLSLNISDISPIPDRPELQFTVSASLNMNCDSIECKFQRDDVHYRVHVPYLILAGQSDSLRSTPQDFDKQYPWDTHKELTLEDITESHTLPVAPGYASGTVAFQGISLAITQNNRYKDQWFTGLHMALRPQGLASQGDFLFNLDLMFKQWNQTTKRRWPLSLFGSGEAHFQSRVVFLQFKEAAIVPQKYTDTLQWAGGDRPADTDQAKKVHPIGVQF